MMGGLSFHLVTDNVTSPLPWMLLTRPLAASQDLAQRYAGKARIIISPVLEIVACPTRYNFDLSMPILATSAHAFRGVSALPGQSPIAYCVGEATARAARAWGANAYYFGNDVSDLVSRVRDLPDRDFVYLRGRHVSINLAQELVKQGKTVRDIVTYDQRAQPLTSEARQVLGGDERVIVPLFSPRSAEQIMGSGVDLDQHDILVMSQRIGNRVTAVIGNPPMVAKSPTLAAMCDLIDTRLGVRSKGPNPTG